MSKRRGLQKRAAEVLLPLGFTAIGGTAFTRQSGKQLHFVGLQYGGFSRGFTFNLGCHFQGVPSMSDFQPVGKEHLDDLDCGLRIRVGRYIGEGRDIWWTANNSELPAALAQASWAIGRAFDDCMKKWGTDGVLILRSHVKNRAGVIRLSRLLFEWMLPKRDFERYAFVALLAHHHGDDELAMALYEKAMSAECPIIPHIPKLAAALGIAQKKSATESADRGGMAASRKSKSATKS
jgi:hypothetical protein